MLMRAGVTPLPPQPPTPGAGAGRRSRSMICFETAMVRSRWTRRYCSVSPKEDADAESYGGEDCWGTRIAEFGTMEFRGSTRGGAIKSYLETPVL